MARDIDRQDINADAGDMPDILLVEDNPLHVRLVKSMLGDIWEGAENLRFAKRLDRAIEMVEDQEPACVLLDLVLPDARDLQAVKAMLDVAPGVPIVVLSSHEDDEMAMQAVSEGAQDYLVKGTVGADQLARSIHFAMQRHRMERPEEPAPAAAAVEDAREPAPAPAPVVVTAEPEDAVVSVIDRNAKVLYAEATFGDMLGRTVGEVIGLSLAEYVHPNDLEVLRTAVKEGADGDPWEVRLRHASGSHLRLRMKLTPLVDVTNSEAVFLARATPVGEAGTAASGAYAVVTEGFE